MQNVWKDVGRMIASAIWDVAWSDQAWLMTDGFCQDGSARLFQRKAHSCLTRPPTLKPQSW